MLPFDGSCDFEMMMRKLNEYGYEGCLMLELGNSRYQDMMTAKEFLEELTRIGNEINEFVRKLSECKN